MAQEAAKTVTVTHQGVEYVVSSSPFEDLDVLEAYEDGKYATLAKALVGPVKYAEFRKTNNTTTSLLELVAALLQSDDEDAGDDE